jgi:hypothetical protein
MYHYELNISRHHFLVGATATQSKSDAWRCSTHKDAFMINDFLQLIQYETAANFIQLNQNLSWDCLLI